MPKSQLTDRQKEVYDLIRSLISKRGYGPTVREIGDNFGIKSPNGVMCHLRALERKGLITRQANKSRAIEITDEHGRSATALPIIGIMSDQPMPVELTTTRTADVGSFAPEESHYVIQMSGDSLTGCGILDGDYVVIATRSDPDPGQLVIAEVEDGQAMLRFWHPRTVGAELCSANEKVGPVIEKNAKVLGVAVSVVRKL